MKPGFLVLIFAVSCWLGRWLYNTLNARDWKTEPRWWQWGLLAFGAFGPSVILACFFDFSEDGERISWEERAGCLGVTVFMLFYGLTLKEKR